MHWPCGTGDPRHRLRGAAAAMEDPPPRPAARTEPPASRPRVPKPQRSPPKKGEEAKQQPQREVGARGAQRPGTAAPPACGGLVGGWRGPPCPRGSLGGEAASAGAGEGAELGLQSPPAEGFQEGDPLPGARDGGQPPAPLPGDPPRARPRLRRGCRTHHRAGRAGPQPAASRAAARRRSGAADVATWRRAVGTLPRLGRRRKGPLPRTGAESAETGRTLAAAQRGAEEASGHPALGTPGPGVTRPWGDPALGTPGPGDTPVTRP